MQGFDGRRFPFAFAAMAVMVCALDAPAQTSSLAPNFVAPPIAWAKPFKGGAIRVAAVIPEDGVGDLEALEAGFDLKLEVHAFGERTSVTFGDAINFALARPCDALIVSAVSLAEVPAETQVALAARIENGMGLLWAGFATNGQPELRDYLAPLGLAPPEAAPDFATRAGGGALADLRPGFDDAAAYAGPGARAVELRFWRARPAGHALLPLTPADALDAPMNADIYRAIVGRALLWCARRDPEAVLLQIKDRAPQGPSEETTPPQLPAEFVERMRQASMPRVVRPYTLVLDRPAPRKYSLRVQARYPDRGIRWSYTADESVSKGATEALLGVPAGAGRCLLDVWLMDGAKIVDWITQTFDFLPMPSLSAVSFNRAVLERNDRLRISAQVRGRARPVSDIASARPGDVLFLRVTDSLGRVVAMHDAAVPAEAAEMVHELSLLDLLAPYARAEVFAATSGDSVLNSWVRERAAYRSADLVVRQPLPPGLAIIVAEPGEGSFAGSARRRPLAARGVDYIFTGAEPDIGNILADGVRPIGRLDIAAGEPGAALDPRSRAGAALRQSAARYASARPGLYVMDAGGAHGGDADSPENRRILIEKIVHEGDPHGLVALLDGEFSAPGTGGFRVLPADPAGLEDFAPAAGGYAAIRTALPEGGGSERCRWLPWLCAIRRVNALWIDVGRSNGGSDSLDEVLSEAGHVREGFDVLFARAKASPASGDPAISVAADFKGISARFEFGKAAIYAWLADPAAKQRAAIRVTAGKDAHVYDSLAPVARASRALSMKLRAGEAGVACVLPYEVTRIALDFPRAIVPGRRLTVNASVKTRGALPGDHVLRMSCYDLAGRRLDHYSRTMFARDGAGMSWIPLAFNEVPGSYRIVVRDVLSGVEAEEWFMVEAAPQTAPGVPR